MRPSDAVRLTYGLVLILAPRRVASTLGASLDGRATATARVLGVRHVAQAAVLSSDRGVQLRPVAQWVDRLHAGSMLLLAAWAPGRERVALTDATIAASFAAFANPASREAAIRRQQSTVPRSDLLELPAPAHPFGVSVPDDNPDAQALVRRRRDAQLQQAVYEAYLQTRGGELDDVRNALTRAIDAAGLGSPTSAWLTAAAVDIAAGNIYVVNGPAMHDVGLQLPPHGPT
jgi:hypothetical protein